MTLTNLIKVNNKAFKYYRDCLSRNTKAKDYLYQRVSKETADIFGIGYAPPTPTLIDLLSDQLESAVNVGLLFSDDYEYVFQRFRNRIMFPIIHAGKVVGFGGRTIGNDKKKYINSPATSLYNKSEILFGLHTTRKNIEQEGYAILVEGYFDVVGLYDCDVKNVCALCGTAFTINHVFSLKRYCDQVYLMLDPDDAGKKAAKKAKKLLKSINFKYKEIGLPGKRDPDEFVKKFGKERLLSYVS